MTWRPRIDDPKKPKYLALVEALESDIATGALRHGDRLPPQREIADRLDTTIATITKAIREATRRGLVTARTGSGTFVRIGADTSATDKSDFDLSLNTVPSSPTKIYLDAALEELAGRRGSEKLCAYEPANGSEEHRTAIVKWLRKRDLSPAPHEVLLTHGSQHALAACFYALTKPGDTVLCEQWTYTGIQRLADLNRVRIEGVSMDAEGMVPCDLKQKLKSTGAKIVICTAAVQNPTTATMSTARRREIVSLCDNADVLIVEDDIYGILSGEEAPPLAALNPQRTVHISSLSKCLAPGIRLGTVLAPANVISALQNALISLHWTAPTFWAELFVLLLSNGSADKCVAAHRKESFRRLGLFQDIVGPKPSTKLPSYHIWQTIPEQWKLDEFVSELASLGIKISPAQHFAVPTSSPPAHDSFRICLGGGNDLNVLKDQLSKLKTVMTAKPRTSTTII